MASVSAAERQRKHRERLKAAGAYNDYKLRNANYSRTYQIKKVKEFENLKTEDKEKLLKETVLKQIKDKVSVKKKKKKKKKKSKPSYCCFSKQIRALIQSRIKSCCQ